jgi:alpha-L-arabinofuranosidase
LCHLKASTTIRDMMETVSIDITKTRTPISKYIYGQFIEHLGRSIYGGLWAEMIQDRKFFYPITDGFDPWGTDSDKQWNAGTYKFLKASPWKVMGKTGSVQWDGEKSVTIHEGGISQDEIAVIQGKKYVGRIVLTGSGTSDVEVRLIAGTQQVSQRFERIEKELRSYPLDLVAPQSTENARLEIIGTGIQIAAVSLMPADNINGWGADVVALLKELDSPIYRWPGGNFVSGYDWKDGIGELDNRPTRKNPAWKSIEPNDVGIHEFMDLMRIIGAEPYVALNTGLGTTDQAVEEVEYCNGSVDTPMGKLRAANGHPKPFGVVWWAVGNEMYGEWQLGFMPLTDYAQKHNAMADAVWKIEPAAKLVAVGNVGAWDQTMLGECADRMTLIAEHTYTKEKLVLAEHVGQLAVSIRGIADAHREYRRTIPSLAGRDIQIALDEWNYWYGDYVFGELGCRYRLKDGLGVARGLHEMFRNSDLFFMANYAQTVNVLGAIKTSGTHSCLETTGEVLKLYRKHFGTIPISIEKQPEELDVAAAWTEDRTAITVAIVNWGEEKQIKLRGTTFSDHVQRWEISGPDAESFNDPGKPSICTIVEKDASINDGLLEIPKLSVVLHRLELQS